MLDAFFELLSTLSEGEETERLNAWFLEVRSADVGPYVSQIPAGESQFAAGLASILQMSWDPQRQPPFSPLMIFGNRRTVDASDIPPHQSEALESLADFLAPQPVKARLFDLAWEVKKSNHSAARKSVSSYLETIECVLAGDLIHQFDEDGGVTRRTADLLRRAAYISKRLGGDHEAARLKAVSEKAAEATFKKGEGLVPIITTAFSFGLLQDPDMHATRLLKNANTLEDRFRARDLAIGAERIFRSLKHDEKVNESKKVQSSIAREIADGASNSAMFQASWLATAIDDLKGIKDIKELKKEIYAELIEAQERSIDEMGTYEHSTDVSDLIRETEKRFEDLTPYETLLALFNLTFPSKIRSLVEEAQRQSEEFPLQGLFQTTIVDERGRVVARPPKQDHPLGIPANLLHTISRNIELRNDLVASTQLRTARYLSSLQELSAYIDFEDLFRSSPFVPNDAVYRFTRAMAFFINGDDAPCAGLLLPQFEDCLRHTLRAKGTETSKLESDGTQKLATLSNLFDHYLDPLVEVFGADWVFEAEMIFTNPIGQRLRHDWSHGLVSDGRATSSQIAYANWFILRITLVPLFKHLADKIENERGSK